MKSKLLTAVAVLAALSVAAFSSPSYALTFHFSFTDGIGTVTGEIDGLTAGGTGEKATHVFIDSAPFSIGFPLPFDTINNNVGFQNSFDVNASGQITSYGYTAATGGFVYDLCLGGPCNFNGNTGFTVFLLAGGIAPDADHVATSSITFTSDAVATPLPAALPLFASGLGALGLLGWRRKRKAIATA